MTSASLTDPMSAAGKTAETSSWPGWRFSSARTAEASRTGSLTLGRAPPVLGEFVHEADTLRHVVADDGLLQPASTDVQLARLIDLRALPVVGSQWIYMKPETGHISLMKDRAGADNGFGGPENILHDPSLAIAQCDHERRDPGIGADELEAVKPGAGCARTSPTSTATPSA
jgi:hypothetical protein